MNINIIREYLLSGSVFANDTNNGKLFYKDGKLNFEFKSGNTDITIMNYQIPEHLKLVLMRISDLKNSPMALAEIHSIYSKAVPILENISHETLADSLENVVKDGTVFELPYNVVKRLISMGYDVYNLIDSGDALELNVKNTTNE
ncbi:hypothetical protein BPT24_254 [Tenacibaculum phage pT24]|uniref:Uncharacterized protein n=1 Tax=Tenacibaculum phage pT24 TaxID=1880590 RepID=A0A1B4XX43_9CAUD|nr:hypothetical protein HYP10_gp274 [Tenacibaculum phage pT24]BAV39373.1 hypothetical protein BPT24_254 [Tenacibaculum phage pT24]